MWYTANLLFKSTHSKHQAGEAIWEESVRLIKANNEGEARQRAIDIGRSSQPSYAIEGDANVKWTFVQVERVCEIDVEELTDGVELFSRFLRSSEVESILKPID